MSKIFTWGQATADLARYVDNGSCGTVAVASRLNEAVERLIAKPEMESSPQLNATVRIAVCNREFPLPRGVEKIRMVDLNGVPGYVFNRAYQFLSSGPGDLDYRQCVQGDRALMDLGEDPFMFPVPRLNEGGVRLTAFSDRKSDLGVMIRLRGFDLKNQEIRTGDNLGETLMVNLFQDELDGQINGNFTESNKVTEFEYRELTSLIKPVTKGYVTIYAIEVSTNKMWLVSKLHPNDTISNFRRYRITNKGSTEQTQTNILAEVKMGYTVLSHEDDIVPIASRAALKLMLIAIKFENEGNIQQAAAYEADAVRIMNEQLAHNKSTLGVPVIIDQERYLMGSRGNHYPRV